MYLDYSNIDNQDVKMVVSALHEGYVSTAAPTVREFEQAMAEWLGVDDCVAVNSGTAALHLALMACGVETGDEVVLPVLTFVGTVNAVKFVRAEPLFVDVNEHEWIVEFPEWIGEDPQYEIFVSLYGNPMIPLWGHKGMIVDDAESLGTLGKVGDEAYRVYSFNGNKIMTTGGGGIIVGQNLDEIRKMIVHRDSTGLSYNYRMPALNAALGLSQLSRLDEFLAKKRRFHEIYVNELDGLVTFQQPTHGSNPSWWMTACLFEEEAVDVQPKLALRGVPTRRIFKPLSNDRKRYPNAWYIYDHGLCLPSSTLNKEKDILTVCKAIKEIV